MASNQSPTDPGTFSTQLECPPPDAPNQPSCYLIGESFLLIECTQVLIQLGFEVKGILSSDKDVQRFADESRITCIHPRDNWAQALALFPFDYLFSIVNRFILPDTILRLPRKMAINYHDSPLPAYAGVNATFWAIVNHETSHGITWHLMDKGIDTGAIIKQPLIALAEKETSISLNLKCYEAAIHSFRQLAGELLSEALQPREQAFEKRTYYPRSKRPARGSVISWQQGAEEIASLCRALDFGFGNNPMGLPKVLIQGTLLILSDVEVLVGPALPPGTVVCIRKEEIHVATSDQLIAIRQVQTLAGALISVSQLVAQFGLYEGYHWEEISPELSALLENLDAKVAPHQDYWVGKLSHFHPATLPFSHRQGAEMPKENLSQIEVPISPAVEAFLLKKTLNAGDFLTTVLFTYLFRISGQSNVGVGYQTDQLVQQGKSSHHLFSDCLPLQLEIKGDTDFEENNAALQREIAAITQHGTYGRDIGLRYPALRAAPEQMRPGSFSVIIRKVQYPGRSLDIPVDAFSIVVSDQPTCTILYNPNAWEGSGVEAVARQLTVLMESLVSQPALPVKSLGLITDQERHCLLYEWNATRVTYPRDRLIHQLVEEQARRRPQSVALTSGEVSLTYDQLDRQANQLARHLQKRGVGPEVMVGICMDRCPEMIVGLLAILKAGGVYVPLDTNYPAERLQLMVEETQACCIITKTAWINYLPANRAQLLLLDANQEEISQESAEPVSSEAQAHHLAYVMFTSGSTGKPKGVCIPHRGVIRLVKGANYANLNEEGIMLGMASTAFDASTLEIWGSLANGGRLVLVSNRQPSLDDLKRIILQQGVNTLFLTTSLFHLFVEQGMEELSTLRQLLTGGEVLSLPHAIKAFRQLPRCRIVNVYGPTENTTFTTFFEIVADTFQCRSVPIGRPLSNTQVYILDPWMQPVPIGMAGELYTGGDGLARGYLNREAFSAERFLANPFFPHLSPFLYKTGDRARYLPDGNIEFLGRIDNQVKIRGFRIEPGEIEHLLCQHSDVQEAVVTVLELGDNDKRLVAYVVVRQGVKFDSSVLRSHLKQKLPEYMVPAWWVGLAKLPLTANGKLDKKSLPLPAAMQKAEPCPNASTPTEQALESHWQQLLRLDGVDHRANFFELGGNSLLVMQLLARLHAQFHLPLSVKDIFNFPTIQRLGQLIDETQDKQSPAAIQIRPVDPGNQALRLSSAQERLWVVSELFRMEGAYNIPVVLKLRGQLSISAWQQSLEEIVSRHQILRTSFELVDNQPFQRVNAAFPVKIAILEAPGHTPAQREAEALEILKEASNQPFDLAKDRLFRVVMVQVAPDTHLLLLTFHHIICDGWSLHVLRTEFNALYTAFLHQQPAPLKELALQYTDYTHWQLQQAESSHLKKQLTYWQRQLTGMLPLVNLPLDNPRPAIQTFQGADLGFQLPLSLTQQLQKVGQASGATLFMTLLTLFKILLSKYSHNGDMVVGTPIANRSHQNLEPLMGFFVNTLVLRTDLSGENLSFRELLERVRRVAVDAYTHPDVPFEQLVEALNPPRSLSYPPLVQVVFDLQERPTESWQLPGLLVDELFLSQRTAKFDLHLSFRQTAQGLQGTFNYNTDLFEQVTIEKLVHHFQQLATEMARDVRTQVPSLLSNSPTHRKALQALLADRPLFDDSTSMPISPGKVTPGNPVLSVYTEKQLAVMWARILKMERVGLDDHFFELGGNSLLAIRLAAEIRLQTGYHLPVAIVFAKPTVRQMAAYLGRESNVWHPLVSVQPKGSRKPLFCVHPANGGIEYVHKLATYLSQDQPLYGLQAVGLNGIDKPLETIEAMAAHYVELILSQHPEGPYQLAGYSLGGGIAYEMTRLLMQKKKEVRVLALFDSYPYRLGQLTYFHMPVRFVLLSSWNYLSDSSISLEDKWRAAKREACVFWRHLWNLNKRTKVNDSNLAVSEASSHKLNTLGLKAYQAYQLKPYPGKAVFFRAIEGTAKYVPYSDFGWKRYLTQGVDVYDLPGDHKALFQSSKTAEAVAKTLEKYLQ